MTLDRENLVEAPWLVADIGGTNARFALVRGGGRFIDEVASMRCADFTGPQEALREYLDRVGVTCPRVAAFAVATPVLTDAIQLTNSAWAFSRAALQSALGLDRLLVINDFAALAHALPTLQPAQYRVFAGPAPAAGEAMAVIGPGTGLGVAAIVPSPRGWIAVPSEGGHATLSAGTPFELEVLQAIRRRFEHVSAERVLSGIGLPTLYTAVAAVRGEPGEVRNAEEVTRRAIAGETCAAATLDTFCALLGGFAGNIALTFGAHGGVFIGGGIVAELGEPFLRSSFRERFESKGRFTPWLREVATPLITAREAALLGAAAALAEALAA
jgi:glucokinase